VTEAGVTDRRAKLALVTTARRVHNSYQDYLRTLEISTVKLEYCDGEIYAMAGGTPAHADLAAAAIALLVGALGPRCRVSTSDLKVRVEATDLSTFPDVSVVCGQRETSPIDANAVVNPTLLVEVTSPSTEDYDRGDKLSHYRQLPSLEAVLLVSHRRPEVTVVERVEGGWRETIARAGESIVVDALELSIPVDALYRGIDLNGSSGA